eukprot:CAMPEP_0173445476 /NCGR_PEP_ID=MMETSP1357-20121228/34446_1 /TAXON_ID=77926 /ORGANISM="Hemiselmis rufescens, Strain PCC563" /LENGTH=38 /DNA_ID= /DNA_START= /DNA_END= /DNA_ORIENTATION=
MNLSTSVGSSLLSSSTLLWSCLLLRTASFSAYVIPLSL